MKEVRGDINWDETDSYDLHSAIRSRSCMQTPGQVAHVFCGTTYVLAVDLQTQRIALKSGLLEHFLGRGRNADAHAGIRSDG